MNRRGKFGGNAKFKLNQWVMPHTRAVLVSLVVVNVAVAGLMAFNTPVESEVTPALPPLQADELKLLSEVASQPRSNQFAANLERPDGEAQRPAKACRSFGPESSVDAFTQIRSALESSGAFPEIRQTQIQGEPDLLVYVDTAGSGETAKLYSAELAAAGIESYVMRRESGIVLSVGVFSQQRHAQERLERVEKLGYTTVLDTLPRTQVVYNLEAYVEVDSPLYERSTSACMTFAQDG